jgi:hypothetical protein
VFGADLLIPDRRFAISNPGDHLADIYRLFLVVMHQAESVPCATLRGLRL